MQIAVAGGSQFKVLLQGDEKGLAYHVDPGNHACNLALLYDEPTCWQLPPYCIRASHGIVVRISYH